MAHPIHFAGGIIQLVAPSVAGRERSQPLAPKGKFPIPDELSLNVAIVLGDLNRHCGPSVHGLRLAGALHRLGHDVTIVHQSRPAEYDEAVARAVPAATRQLPAVHPLNPLMLSAFHRILSEAAFDVVVFLIPTHAIVLSIATRLASAASVFVMGTEWEYNAAWIQRGLQIAGNHTINHIVGISRSVCDSLRSHGIQSHRVSLLYNGVEIPDPTILARTRRDVRAELNIQSDTAMIGTCGRLVEAKEPMTLLVAAAELVRRHVDFHLLVVGDGDQRPMLQEFAAQNGLGDKCSFVGWRSDVNRYLSAMDVFVFHSKSEGLGQVAIEAAAVGLPMVLPDLPCLREVFRENNQALFAEAGSVRQYADTIEHLIESPTTRAALGSAARSRVTHDFSEDTMGILYDQLFRCLLCGHP